MEKGLPFECISLNLVLDWAAQFCKSPVPLCRKAPPRHERWLTLMRMGYLSYHHDLSATFLHFAHQTTCSFVLHLLHTRSARRPTINLITKLNPNSSHFFLSPLHDAKCVNLVYINPLFFMNIYYVIIKLTMLLEEKKGNS